MLLISQLNLRIYHLRNYYGPRARYQPSSWSYFNGSPTHLTNLTTNNLAESLNMAIGRLFPKTGKLGIQIQKYISQNYDFYPYERLHSPYRCL